VNDLIPVTKTGPLSALGDYAEMGDLFLTTQITGAEADQMRDQVREVAGFLPTDEVWGFTTSSKSWQCLAGRAGYVLVRDGVVICEMGVCAMS